MSKQTTSKVNPASQWFGAAARNTAYVPIMMAFFMLVYAVWFVFAWGYLGVFIFSLSILYAAFVGVMAIRHIKHALKFPNIATPEGAALGKKMGILSGVSYGLLWLVVIALALVGLWQYIMQSVTLIIGLHFIPLGQIFNRKVDYIVGPLAAILGVVGIILTATDAVSWLEGFALSSIGGAIATSFYAAYNLKAYRTMARSADADYNL